MKFALSPWNQLRLHHNSQVGISYQHWCTTRTLNLDQLATAAPRWKVFSNACLASYPGLVCTDACVDDRQVSAAGWSMGYKSSKNVLRTSFSLYNHRSCINQTHILGVAKTLGQSTRSETPSCRIMIER